MLELTYEALGMPEAMADDSSARDVLELYVQLNERAVDAEGRPSDYCAAMQEVQCWEGALQRIEGPRSPQDEINFLTDRAFDVGFRRGVIFARWLDATLANPVQRKRLIGVTMDFPWLLDDGLPDLSAAGSSAPERAV